MNKGLKGVFCYDEPVMIDERGCYYSSTMKNEMFEKYLQLVESLVICAPTNFMTSVELEDGYIELAKDQFQLTSVPSLSSLKSSFFNRRQLKKEVATVLENADILIVRLPSLIGYMAIDVAKAIGKPYLVEVVECAWSSSWHRSVHGKLLAVPNFLMMRRRVRQASHVMYVTEQFLQERYPSNGSMLSCADVDLPESDELVLIQRDVKIARRHLREPIVLGAVDVADLKYKAHVDVLEAMAQLKNEGYRFRYKLVGDGSQHHQLRKQVERLDLVSEVQFLSPLSQEEMVEFLDEIDVYVQASSIEGLPKTLIEAMSRGCPAIGVNVGGIPELLEQKAIYEVGKIDRLGRLLRESVAKDWMYDRAKANFKKTRYFESEYLAVVREACYAEVKSVCFGK